MSLARLIGPVAIFFSAASLTGAATAQQPATSDQTSGASSPASQQVETEDRVIISAMVPVPDVGKGAPYRSLDDLARMKSEAGDQRVESMRDIQQYRQCRQQGEFDQRRLSSVLPSMEGLLAREIELANRFNVLAGEAAEATRAAEESRRKDAALDMRLVEQAELKRQDAINKLDEARVKLLEVGAAIADFQELDRRGQTGSVNGQFNDDDDAITWADLDIRAVQRRKAGWWEGIPAPDIPKDLAIAGIEARQFDDRKGAFVRVTGQIRNSGKQAAKVPDLVVSTVDPRGWVIEAKQLAAPSSPRIPAGGSRPFAYDLRPVPGATFQVSVSFGSKIAPPSRRAVATPDC